MIGNTARRPKQRCWATRNGVVSRTMERFETLLIALLLFVFKASQTLLIALLLFVFKASPIDARGALSKTPNWASLRCPPGYQGGCDDGEPGWVYVIEIVERRKLSKFYVGSTKDWKKRIDDHLNGRGAKCLRQFPAAAMERIYLRRYKSGKDARAGEERKCKQMIENYGEAKVRGSNRKSKFTD